LLKDLDDSIQGFILTKCQRIRYHSPSDIQNWFHWEKC